MINRPPRPFPPPDPGELQQVLLLQRLEQPTTFDAEGRPEEVWTTFAKLRARVVPLDVSLLLSARAAGQTITHHVTMRYRRELATPPLPGGSPSGHDLRLLEERRPPLPPRVLWPLGIGDVDESGRWMSIMATELVQA